MNRSLKTTHLAINGVCISALLLCAFAYYAYVFSPLEQRKTDAEQEIARLRTRITTTQRSHKGKKELSNELDNLKNRARQVRERIPDEPREANFLGLVSTAAVANGLVIDDYRRGRAADKGSHWELEITLHGRGSFAGICRFVNQLESLPRQVTIRDFQIKRETKEDTYPIVLSVLLYYGANESAGGTHG